VEAIRAEGLEVPVIATALAAAGDAWPILSAAGALGVRFFRPGWLDYGSDEVAREVQRAAQVLSGLADVGKRAGVELAYQNHVGRFGAAVWDLHAAIEPLDPRWAGIYFDVRHAVAEGSAGSWLVGARLVGPRIKVLGVKDCRFEGNRVRHCPLGEGMVDVRAALSIAATAGFRGPIVLYVEYETADVLEAAARDLEYLRGCLRETA
jgi:sugar phosphate isomerase/epimerase